MSWVQSVLIVVGVIVLIVVLIELPPQHRFIDAAGNPDLEKLKKWLEKGRDPNRPGFLGLTALGAAVTEAHPQNVKLLLANRADPNQRSVKQLPLQCAMEKADLEIVTDLLDAGADPLLPGMLNVSPIEEAATSGKIDVLRIFLDRGADANVRVSRGQTLLMAVVLTLSGTRNGEEKQALRKVVQLLLDRGASPNTRSEDDVPLLMAALNDPPTLRILVDAGAITAVSYQGLDLEPSIREALQSNDM